MIDEKEQAWLRLRAFELTAGWAKKGTAHEDYTLAHRIGVANSVFQWAVTGSAPEVQP